MAERQPLTQASGLPCGKCGAGTYSVTPILQGLKMFGDCMSRKEALATAPRCKCDGKHICYGARDWIIAAKLPMSAGDKAALIQLCTK